MHYYSSADEPSLGPPLIFCAPPHFNFMELKWGPKRKVGAQKKIFRRFAPEMGPHFQFASYAPDPYIQTFSTLSGVRLMSLILLQLAILCTSAAKRYCD